MFMLTMSHMMLCFGCTNLMKITVTQIYLTCIYISKQCSNSHESLRSLQLIVESLKCIFNKKPSTWASELK